MRTCISGGRSFRDFCDATLRVGKLQDTRSEEEGVRNVGDDSKVFVGRGFSHDINNAAAKGLQPLKFPRAGSATHFSAREAI